MNRRPFLILAKKNPERVAELKKVLLGNLKKGYTHNPKEGVK